MSVSQSDIDRLNALLGTAMAALADVSSFARGLRADDPPPTPVPDAIIRTAVHRYWLQGPIVFADVYDLQDSQWIDLKAFPSGAKLFKYVSTANLPSDTYSDRQFVSSTRSSAYRVKDTSGKLISRTGNETDYLLDIGSSALRNLIVNSIGSIVAKGFHGLYLDEVDDTWLYGYPNSGTIQLSNGSGSDAWRAAMILFVRDVANELHRLGKQLWINLGLTGSTSTPWRDQMIQMVDAVNIEYFVGKDYLKQPVDVDQNWVFRVGELSDIENAGKPVHAHCSSTKQTTIDYAFASWLMGTQFLGSFCASVEYDGNNYLPSIDLQTSAANLGRPVAPMGTVSTGYARRFEHGTVYVNPFSSPRSDMAPMTWRIRPST